jgi:hypothetical protein
MKFLLFSLTNYCLSGYSRYSRGISKRGQIKKIVIPKDQNYWNVNNYTIFTHYCFLSVNLKQKLQVQQLILFFYLVSIEKIQTIRL